ncbi:MAG: glycerophosphodiester phosphodiesterase family protein [Chthoniobacterales bacterium]
MNTPLRSSYTTIKLLFCFMSSFFLTPLLAAELIQPGMPHSPGSSQYIEVYAHRGARGLAPENTVHAYQKGLAIGTDWVDMDIGITRDGVLVVYHDLFLNPDILRKNGKFWAKDKTGFLQQLTEAPGGIEKNIQPYLIKNLSLEELQQYDAGRLNPDSSYARYFQRQEGVDGIKVPTLKEVITTVNKITDQHAFFQIEIKNDPTHLTWTVSREKFATTLDHFLRKNKLVNRVEIQAFDWKVLMKLHQLNPDLKLAFLVTKDGITKMHDPDPAKARLWTGGYLLTDYKSSIPQMIKDLGGSCYEPEDRALTKEDLEEAHRLGLKVVVWTWPEVAGSTFDPPMINKLISWGVDGIITDDPDKLRASLADHGLPLPPSYPSAYPGN